MLSLYGGLPHSFEERQGWCFAIGQHASESIQR